MGNITYDSLVTLPPEFAILDLLTIQLWGGRPAYLYQVRQPRTCTHPACGLSMTRSCQYFVMVCCYETCNKILAAATLQGSPPLPYSCSATQSQLLMDNLCLRLYRYQPLFCPNIYANKLHAPEKTVE